MPTAMPPMPNKDDAHGTWLYLQAGVEKIMVELQEGMDMKTYMGLYTAIHNFCTAQKAVSTGGFSHNRGGAHLLGEELYNHLISYLQNHLAEVHTRSKSHVDEALLTFYIKEWARYTTAGQYNNHLFRYLNRHWVKREMDEGKKNIYDIYTLHLVRWKEDMFMATHNSVMSSVLKLVEKQRNGETIEQSQIRSIVQSFVSLGLDESDSSKTTLDVYKEHFEKPFLEATSEYYKNESKSFVAVNSVVEYMKKAEQRLDEEKERVGLYLLADIMNPLMKACEEVLITAHADTLIEEFQVLLDNDRQADMARMYRLLSRIPSGLDPLRQKFETHVRKEGLAAIDKVAADGDTVEPKIYVEALLDVHTQYKDLVNKAFNGESEFVRSLDNACREFVNRNKVCKSVTTRSPELLARYTDTLLKKSSAKMSEEDDMEKMLGHVMTVFRYIEDKDVFQKFYWKMLAKRLVSGTSASDDAETSMITKLKDACGFEYTNKLQRMFQDMQISKDLNSSYKDWLSTTFDAEDQKGAVEASYQILGTGFWPLNPPTTTLAPPQALIKTYERFQTFYLQKHSGRKLTWLWQYCKGEIKANFTKSQVKTPYTFQVSTYQMAILLLFNDQETLSYEEIEAGTKIGKETLDPSIGVCVKARVLKVNPEGAKPEPGTTYTVNHGFKNKKVKVNLNIVIKPEQKAEADETNRQIEEDRKLLIQSALVRIMKSRKTMQHTMLMTETINQLSSRFQPKVPDIKKCIDVLIEKEYLERLADGTLGYLA
ncbi:cullin-2 [Aulographum hederae CBS 113979]|uniref:Cullin-1 n=1 Tax=Aulographum hederae CBS 113979 TaxID=1176131 RepID=A0A6G1HH72_9PEZI|nr:cullin-2 [Aulographum hederae CBS 113979]